VSADGATVGEALRALEQEFPGLSGQVINGDGTLHKFVNVYLNDDDVRYLSALDTPVTSADEISILPAVAGGATDGTSTTDATGATSATHAATDATVPRFR
jgi:molybdopterin converting factor small subunit